jgi:transcriptional regulator with XRE-family HTH domain
MREFVEFIYELRLKQGLTQTQLADKARVSQSLISKIENNNLDPGFSQVLRIANALGYILTFKKGVKDNEQF